MKNNITIEYMASTIAADMTEMHVASTIVTDMTGNMDEI